eukprot:GGOE01054316.1.p1 GENE.GGOE01054316.1~~GGOE01054316.1.p1  ORF type:complete len:517 (+),score=154.06 GGOE01054316.1:136-1686(+)
MTKWAADSHYGSFDPGNATIQVVEDLSKGEEVKRRVGSLCGHPLNRALMVLVVFAAIGLLLVVVDHTNVPSQQQSAVVSRAVIGGHYGCLAEVGLTGSQLTLYQIDAPWQLLVMQQLDVPMDLSDILKKGTSSSELTHNVLAAFSKHLKDARTIAHESVVFSAVKVKDDVKALSPAVRKTLEQAVTTAMENNGFKQCNNWDHGGCIDKQNILNWGMLGQMDKDVQSWFAKAVANVNNWRDAAKEHGEKVAQEAKDIKEQAKEALDKEGKEAKKKYEEAKGAVEEATRKLHKENHGKKHSERATEKAERELEKELRRAEEEYESIVRKAEKEFDRLERHAEGLLQKAEKELDQIDQKADAKLRRLQEKVDALCKTKCKPQVPAKVPAAPLRPPPPAGAPLPPSAPQEAPNDPHKPETEDASNAHEEEQAPAKLVVGKAQQRQAKVVAAEKFVSKSSKVQENGHDDVPQEIQAVEADNDDEPKPIRMAQKKAQQRFGDDLQRSYLGDFAKLNVRRSVE